jgi:hypothetical protein
MRERRGGEDAEWFTRCARIVHHGEPGWIGDATRRLCGEGRQWRRCRFHRRDNA